MQDNARAVRASGEIDLSNSDKLEAELDSAIKDSPKGIVVDMSDVVYIDSAGIQAILAAYARLSEQGGCLALVIEHPNIKEIFDIIHLDRLPGFVICDDLAAAEQFLTEAAN